MVITGDLNADPEDLPMVQYRIEQEGWKDLGAHPAWWPGGKVVPTCFAANGLAQGTRRDYVLVDPLLFGMIEHFSGVL